MEFFQAFVLLVVAVACCTASQCQNGQYCDGGETCCGGGKFCCEHTATCCSDTCCNNRTETCCADPKLGGVCCIKETTYCCPPSPNGAHPSRCCPRWMVCCDEGGEYGCCDPGVMAFGKANKRTTPQNATTATAPTTAYALFFEANLFADPLKGVTMDLKTGHQTQKKLEKGKFNDWGETVRIFTYNKDKNVFHLPQANFLVKQQPVILYTANPTTGAVTVKTITGGPIGQTTGYSWNSHLQTMIMGTYTHNPKGNITGYAFWHVNVDTAAATQVGTHTFKTVGVDDWVGWFYSTSMDGASLYRIGFKDVRHSLGKGIGVTTIKTGGGAVSTKWVANLEQPSGYSWYMTVHPYNGGFLSLAEHSIEKAISLVKWDLTGNKTIVGHWKNAHLPHYFGPVVGVVDAAAEQYVSAVVKNGVTHELDRWVLALVDLKNNNATEVALDPWMEGETESVSGIGIPLH
eukprot:TRINITY_DN51658_c0_g1_i1.p1 TRINITY_DN51658_c0_g1~~TRINITY_DN51658_c0_g1_i1.p1  ORF type:complete len:461 (+),score=69.94 TRINITY_DN51658_c0_g1_i1:82-1464(+)